MDDILNDEAHFQEALALYYATLFPSKLIYTWLKHDYNNPNMDKREISFELSRSRFLRYKSFASAEEFEHYILRKIPIKIDIGAAYSVPPRDIEFTRTNKAIEKELVFDIDLSDYDDVRTCCTEANICNKCWKFIRVASKILWQTLKYEFGFKCFLWVFSGRRGIHAWVCDKAARALSNFERECILSYINIIKGGPYVARRVNLSGEKISTSIERTLSVITEYFEESILIEQNILGTEEGLKKFLNIIWDAPKSFEDAMRKFETSVERWQAFDSHLCYLKKNEVLPYSFYLKEEVMLHFMYPRLDFNVTKKMDHLLKSPFCVHPKTGKIAIPFKSYLMDEFDVDKVPTLTQVLDEINEHFARVGKEFTIEEHPPELNILSTSLYQTHKDFEKFVKWLDTIYRRHI